MSEKGRARALKEMKREVPNYVESIQQGKTREYVKFAASRVAQEVHDY